jgi:hypothetical protein
MLAMERALNISEGRRPTMPSISGRWSKKSCESRHKNIVFASYDVHGSLRRLRRRELIRLRDINICEGIGCIHESTLLASENQIAIGKDLI